MYFLVQKIDPRCSTLGSRVFELRGVVGDGGFATAKRYLALRSLERHHGHRQARPKSPIVFGFKIQDNPSILQLDGMIPDQFVFHYISLGPLQHLLQPSKKALEVLKVSAKRWC